MSSRVVSSVKSRLHRSGEEGSSSGRGYSGAHPSIQVGSAEPPLPQYGSTAYGGSAYSPPRSPEAVQKQVDMMGRVERAMGIEPEKDRLLRSGSGISAGSPTSGRRVTVTAPPNTRENSGSSGMLMAENALASRDRRKSSVLGVGRDHAIPEFLEEHSRQPVPAVNAALMSGEWHRFAGEVGNLDDALEFHMWYSPLGGRLVVAEGEADAQYKGVVQFNTFLAGSSHSHYLYYLTQHHEDTGTYLLISTGLKNFTLARDCARDAPKDVPELQKELHVPALFHRGSRFAVDRVAKNGGVTIIGMHEIPTWRAYDLWLMRGCPCPKSDIYAGLSEGSGSVRQVHIFAVGARGLPEGDKDYSISIDAAQTPKKKSQYNSALESGEVLLDSAVGAPTLRKAVTMRLVAHGVRHGGEILNVQIPVDRLLDAATGSGWLIVPDVCEQGFTANATHAKKHTKRLDVRGLHKQCTAPYALLYVSQVPAEGGLL